MNLAKSMLAIAAATGLVIALPVSASAASGNPASLLIISQQGASDIPQYTDSAGAVKPCYHLEGRSADEWYKPAAETGKHLRCGAGLNGVWLGVGGAAAIAGIIVAATHHGKPKSP